MSKIRDSRAASFIAVFLVYVLGTLLGVFVYRSLSLDFRISLLVADVAATVFVFVFSLIFSNASVYDPYWSVQPIVILAAYAFGKEITVIRVATLLVVSAWGIRLTANWAYTFKGFRHQDWRYTMLKEKTGIFYPLINFLGIHLVPTLVVYFCTLPAVYVFAFDGFLNVFSLVALYISLFAVVIQGVSDAEMHSFRKNGCGGFIRKGLWRYSRHPNYLGEILMWWGIGFSSFFAFGYYWPSLIGAALNTCLFLFVSIPMADGKQSKKEGFALYKTETRMLLPVKRLFKHSSEKNHR